MNIGVPLATIATPEGVLTASPGTVVAFANGTIWHKASGAGNTGWVLQTGSATKLDDLAAPDDNTDLDASASAHGLMSKADKIKIDTLTRFTGIVTEATTARTLTATDAGKYIRCTNGSETTVTVNSSVFAAEDEVIIIQAGAGAVVFAGTATLTTLTGYDAETAGQGAVVGLKFSSASAADLFGSLAATP